MTYQVLARKWRPRTFKEMVGQEHVLKALINALDGNRLHHAYLFTGTRGVGKTTVARSFAKALNCEKGVTSEPCGVCEACREITEGRFVDLIEVDAASRTKVEDTRELLDNVQYAPTRGRFKVYLIDEVHMLSGHSFNALLKTLEEPPPHVKFLLATTDPQKLPVTILSRCLQFNLKRLPPAQIEQHLEYILEQEGLHHDGKSLRLLAHAADGSMRDALSLLDQAIAYSSGELQAEEVRAMLGTVSREHSMAILRGLAQADPPAVMTEVSALAELAPDYGSVLEDLLGLLHQLALAQIVPEAVDESLMERESLLEIAKGLSPEDVQLFYQIGLIGRRDLPLAPDPRSGLEMVLLRMLAFRPEQTASVQAADASTVSDSRSRHSRVEAVATADSRQTSQAKTPPAAKPQVASRESVLAVTPDAAPAGSDWESVVQALDIKGMVKQLAVNCIMQAKEGSVVSLLLSEAHKQLLNANGEQRLQQALSQYYGQAMQLKISVGQATEETPAQVTARQAAERQQQAEQAIEQDPFVQAVKEKFDAEVVPGSVRPNK